jgi:hypothetical protein
MATFGGGPAQRRPRGRVGEPVAGIPSAGGASRLRHVVIRVALRVAVLAGLVVGGWLLGAATGCADEAWTPEDGAQSLDTGLAALPSSLPAAAGSLIEANAAVLPPAVQGAQLPVQPPTLDATQVLESALQPLRQPVLDPVIQEMIAPLVPSRAAGRDEPSPAAPLGSAEALEPVAPPLPTGPFIPAEPAGSAMNAAAAGTLPVGTLPVPGMTVPGMTLPGASTAAGQLAGWSAVGGDWAPPIPASPPRTAITSCPTAAASGTTKGGVPAVMLSDGCPGIHLPAAQHQMSLRAAGLPRAPDQQPSTSPD